MSKSFSAAFLALFLPAAFSCNALSLEDFAADVLIGEAQSYYGEEWVSICFSTEVDPLSAQNLLSLREGGMAAEANALWLPRCCLVQPAGGWKKGLKYALSFSGSILTQDGRTYSVGLYREFIYGSAGQDFFVEKIEEPEKNNPEKNSLVLCFNKPVDPAAFERTFNISPGAELVKKYSDDKRRVEILPAKKWKANVFYDWRLEKLLSADGVMIKAPCSGSFMALEKNSPPSLICVCPVLDEVFFENMDLNSLWERQAVGFVFDSDMDFESVKSGTNFSPFVEGRWTKIDARRFVFEPYQNYALEKEYALLVSDAVEDEAGLKMAESKNFRFKTQARFIELSASCGGKVLEKDGLNWLECGEGSPLVVDLSFSRVLANDSVLGIKKAASLSPVFPQSAAAPYLETLITGADCLSCSEIRLEFGGFDFSQEDQPAVYKMQVSGGAGFVYDALGEYLKEDECFYIAVKKSL